MSWMNEGLESTEKKSMRMICKTRHAGTSGSGRGFIKEALSESSDEEFDKFLVENFTPKAKTRAPNPRSAAKTDNSNVLVVSSDDEDNFEDFLQRVKTPAAKANKRSESSSEDSLKNFIVNDFSSDDDFIETKSSIRVRPTTITPAGQPSFRRPFAHLNSPVFVSDSGDDDDEDNIVIRSTWKTRHSKPKPPQKAEQRENEKEENRSPASPLLPSLSFFLHPPSNTQTLKTSPQRTLSAPSRLDESSGSEEEFGSLLERLKKKNILTSTTVTPKTSKESEKKVVLPTPALKPFPKPNSKPMKEKPEDVKAQGKPSIVKPKGSQTEPRPATLSRIPVCKTPGCFLDSLTNPGSKYGSSFRTNKEELTSKLYQFYNTSVFDDKLPTNMSVTWNKKMRKTAGYCITGQERSGGSRYARIDLSEKVCDSADRLRDTLIHEMCHAATWLINGVRDGHGSFWKMYARKATIVHPELPVVTRCHSYDIKYKFQYQCTRCKNTIGRHSKSLDTQKFVCALCTGQLILLTPVKARAPTPFATFVKENYGNVRQELVGQSHAEVMRKLSADFASKTKLSES